jgi:hypothetical protein
MSFTLQRSIARPEPNVKPAAHGVGRRMRVTNVTKLSMFQCLTTGNANKFCSGIIPGGPHCRPGLPSHSYHRATPPPLGGGLLAPLTRFAAPLAGGFLAPLTRFAAPLTRCSAPLTRCSAPAALQPRAG